MSEVKTEFLFEIWIELGERWVLGPTQSGDRRIINLSGGRLEGPKIKGEVLNSGADWLIQRPDGTSLADVRLTFRTDDGAIVYMPYTGLITASPEALERRKRGEPVDSSELIIRSTPTFHTGSEKYDWLNRVVAISLGRSVDGKVNYKVYAIV